jgi:hypothetical protein
LILDAVILDEILQRLTAGENRSVVRQFGGPEVALK